jgi:hypothetical protein
MKSFIFLGAIQMVIEEVYLKKRNYPPLNVVGMEGVFGIFLMILIALPLIYFIPGNHQNVSLFQKQISSLLSFQIQRE